MSRNRDLSPSSLSGVGLGLRWEFLDDLIERVEGGRFDVELPFFEICPENYMRRGGYIPESLERVAAHFPIVSHGLQMSIGGVDAFDPAYFAELEPFLKKLGTPWHSDHLCFCGVDGKILHDLFPLPHTEAAARHAAARVREARDRLGLPMAIENISYYLHVGKSELTEAEMVSMVLEEADCQLLLDVNNVYVNSLNHGFDAKEWIEQIDLSRVVQIHVAGHEHRPDDGLVIDTHGAAVVEPVIDLLEWVIARTGPLPVLLERDNDVPDLDVLLAERERLDAAYRRGLEGYRQGSGPSPGPDRRRHVA